MIYTFYSYKGGVGRSMALANVAQWFYEQGLRVVMIDWDLEAPGLENFFYRSPEELDVVRSQLGLIDMLMGYKRIFPRLRVVEADGPSAERQSGAASVDKPGEGPESSNNEPANLGEKSAIDWPKLLRENLPPLSDTLYPIHSPGTNPDQKDAALWLIPAGWRSGDRFPVYAQAVQSFDWTEFYTSYEGEAYFDWMREQLLVPNLADVVLIDSRTGVTEMGGVCTRQMADIVVSYCVPNSGNLAGVHTMAKSFTRDEIVKKRQRPLELVVVPSRLDISEVDDRKAFEDQFRATLDEFTPPAFESVNSSFWDLQIQYVPKFAYREGLAINDSRVPELEKAYKKLTVHLALLAQGESGERIRTKCATELQREFASHLPGLYQLTEEERARYLQLAFFPENADIPLSDAQELWGSDAPATEKLVRRLAGIALLTYDTEQQTARLNSVLRAQLLEQMPDQDALNEKIEAAFGSFSIEEQEAARRILTRLVRLVSPDEDGNDTRLRVPLSEWDASSQAVVAALAEAKLVTIEPDKSTGLPVVQIANEAYLRGWRRLADWRIEDRDFLLWRQQLKLKIAEWEATKHDRGALLSGGPLAVATRWRERRPDELNVSETAYIEESVNELKRYEQAQQQSAKALRRRRWWIAAVTLITLVIFAIPITVSIRQRRAEEQRRQAEEAARKKAEDLNNFGAVELKSLNYELALKDFSEAINAKPDYADSYLNRARAYHAYNSKLYSDQALADFSQALKLKPDLAVAYLERADLYTEINQDNKAIDDYTSAIKIKSDYWVAYLKRGAAYERTKQIDAAIADYNQIIQSTSDQLKVKAYQSRAWAYYIHGDKNLAIADLLQTGVLSADPGVHSYADAGLKALGYKPEQQNQALAAPRVFLEYNDAQDGPVLEAIRVSLQQSGFSVRPKDLSTMQTILEVRYYSQGNKANVEKVRSIVTDTLASQSKSTVKPVIVLTYLGDYYRFVPRENIEVWIPQQQQRLSPSGLPK